MTRCVSCGHVPLEQILDLGQTPLANALLEHADLVRPEPRFPLRVGRCPQCALVQITELVPSEQLFSDYVYFSSFSDGMLRHAQALTAELIAQQRLDADSLVIELASNDGYLLQYYRQAGIPVLGIEPAANIAAVAVRERGIPTLNAFFGRDLGRQLAAEGRRAQVVHAHNVFAHVPDPTGFLAGMHDILAPGGVAVIEVPYLRDLLDKTEFDTIYHEHVSYFALTPIARMAQRAGLAVADVRRISIHGGSLQVRLTHAGADAAPAVDALLAEERAWGVDDPATYSGFSRRVGEVRQALVALLDDLRRSGQRLAAYGAAAKGATLLNYCGIDTSQLEFVADRSPHKVGKYMPGSHLPILPATSLVERRPDFALLLSWNFADEILAQQSEYRRQGGRFIIPVPTAKIV